MNKIISIIALFLVASCSTTKKETVANIKSPNIIFTITEGIAHPESVLYSKEHSAIFVTNINSGNPLETKRVGTISKYSPEGKLIASPWANGLKPPKGMARVGNFLYVSDIDQVVKVDIKTSKIVQTKNIPGAKFLNDVVADDMGNIYIADMMTDTIHIWDKKGVRVWLKTPALRSPNGLFTDGKEHIIMASWGNPIDAKNFTTQNVGAISTLSLKSVTEKITEENSIRGNLDGIAMDANGDLWISDWMNGDIYQLKKNGSAQKVYNLSQGAADLSFAKELNLLLVPQMNQSKVFAIKLD